jgi:hypothetical protein
MLEPETKNQVTIIIRAQIDVVIAIIKNQVSILLFIFKYIYPSTAE